MPRKGTIASVSSAFREVQTKARALLAGLQKQIRSKEDELRRLRDEEARLAALLGRSESVGSMRSGTASAGSGRINWRTVLEQLPRQFKASDVRAVRGLKFKRPSEIFAAITRWIEAGLVKRKTRGAYEKA